MQWQSPGQRRRRTAADRPSRQHTQLAAGHHGRDRAAAEDAQRQRRLDSARSAGGRQQRARADISGSKGHLGEGEGTVQQDGRTAGWLDGLETDDGGFDEGGGHWESHGIGWDIWAWIGRIGWTLSKTNRRMDTPLHSSWTFINISCFPTRSHSSFPPGNCFSRLPHKANKQTAKPHQAQRKTKKETDRKIARKMEKN